LRLVLAHPAKPLTPRYMRIAEYYLNRKPRIWCAICLLMIVASPSATALADNPGPGLAPYDEPAATLARDGWRQLRVKERAVAEFQASDDGALTVNTNNSAGFLYRPLTDAEASKSSLTWSWRVDKMPAPSDLSEVGADDRPLAVHIWFPVDTERASLWQVLRSGIGGLLDLPVPGKILTYVWGGTQDEGTRIVNPYLPTDGVIIVLRSGRNTSQAWQEERVDFAADFKAAFGRAAPRANYLVISADTDDRGDISAAAVKDIRFDG